MTVESTPVEGSSTFATLRGPVGGADVLETTTPTTIEHEVTQAGTYRGFVSSGGHSDVTILVERRA